jgi:hypothetical protein
MVALGFLVFSLFTFSLFSRQLRCRSRRDEKKRKKIKRRKHGTLRATPKIWSNSMLAKFEVYEILSESKELIRIHGQFAELIYANIFCFALRKEVGLPDDEQIYFVRNSNKSSRWTEVI